MEVSNTIAIELVFWSVALSEFASRTQMECPGLTSASDRHAGVLMAAGQQQRGMFIQTQPTPNPTSLMFMPGQGVMEVGPWAPLDAVHLASVCSLNGKSCLEVKALWLVVRPSP